jgi:hypothetical protein
MIEEAGPQGCEARNRRTRLVAGWATALLVAALLSLMAPWGTWRLGLPVRIGYFLACALFWKLGLAVGRRLVARLTPSIGGPGAVVLMVLAGSIPASAGTELSLWVVTGHTAAFAPLYLESLVLGLVIAFAYRGLFQAQPASAFIPKAPASAQARPAAASPAASVPPMPEAFLARHAPDLAGRRLLALEAEDHYLRIHVVGASTLVLLRMRDATEMLGASAGWQPHRSFWLANGCRARAERRGQGWQLALENGLVVPVSRAALPAMRAAGFGAGLQAPASVSAVGSTAE